MNEQPGGAEPGWMVAAGTALAYAVVGWLALLLALPPGYASPLYPPAGIALAATLVYGRPALLGAGAGAFLVNVVLNTSRGQFDLPAFLLPAFIGVGATLQAGVGAALVRRHVGQPLLLEGPREILRTGLLGAIVACTLSPSIATSALLLAGAVPKAEGLSTWGTWWVGDTLGVLIGAPLALTLIGQPRAAWAPRRRTVGLPLLLATLLLAAATLTVSRWDQERAQDAFDHDADELVQEISHRLARPVYALQTLHAGWLAAGRLDAPVLRSVTAWWLAQPLGLQAMGYSERVPRTQLAAFENRARAEGLPEYRVFEREAAVAAGDADVLALRLIEPQARNVGALGVNTLSVPAAREAVLASRASGQPAATRVFTLTQAGAGPGVVIYQALYEGREAPPATPQAREQRFSGVVFVTASIEGLFKGLLGSPQRPLQWCLSDRDSGQTVAGAPGCARAALPASALRMQRELPFAGRMLQLQLHALPVELRHGRHSNAWLFSVAGMLAASLLGALLLTVTGRARRIEHAVDQRTAELQREVAERSLAEQALRASEARVRGILDNVPIGVLFTDGGGQIVEINPQLCELLGRPALQLMLIRLDALVHPEDRTLLERLLAKALAEPDTIVRHGLRLLRRDGSVLAARVHLTALRDADGAPQRLAGAVEDITEHLRLEASERALHEAEAASRAKSEFVSRMSHELRTPLNAMIGFAQLLALDRQPALAAHQREWTGQMQHAGWHLLEMINDTLDLARIESGAVQLSPRVLDLHSSVAASLAMVSQSVEQRGLSVQVEIAPDAAAARGDDTRVKQILTNLLSNACKYNQTGGSVLVHAERRGEQVAISVQDSGIGMSPEQMAALFQPYNRLGREHGPIEGTGIGLVISRRLAELMDGALEAASSVGAGSTFTLLLPWVAPVAPPPTAREAAAAQYHRRRVHYIEDNETNVEIMRGIVAQRPQIGLEVSAFGLDGLAAIRQHRPDLILLDMHLPDISGLELLRHLKQDDHTADIPVIVLSADATTARMQEALTLGAAQYVTKPVDIAGLLAALDALLQNMETRWG